MPPLIWRNWQLKDLLLSYSRRDLEHAQMILHTRIDAYRRLAAQGEKVLAFRADECYWRDLGRPADLSQAALDFRQRVIE